MRPPLAAASAALLAALAAVGCGGDDDAFARYSVRDVQARVRELTGVTVRARRTGDGTTALRFPVAGSDGPGGRRYSGASLEVFTDEGALRRATDAARTGPTSVVGNVLVRGSYGYLLADFGRLDAVVRSLGRPASSAPMQREDVLCSRAGIDPAGGDSRPGTCSVGGQVVRVVGADGPLRVDGATVSHARARVTRTVVSRAGGRTRRLRAAGVFVVVAVRVENPSSTPYSGQPAALVVGGRRFAPDERQYLVDDARYPISSLRPRAVETFLFDVPAGIRDPVGRGALELTNDGTLVDPAGASSVGRIRLRAER